jgi:hypothetical protein
MAMYLGECPVYTVMLIGRWSSDAFLRYIRKQVMEFSHNVSKKCSSSKTTATFQTSTTKSKKMTRECAMIRTTPTWLGKSPTCRRHVGPTAKSRHIWPTGPRRADTISFPTHFCVSGIADFLQIFSKYQRYVRSNHRTNWYV